MDIKFNCIWYNMISGKNVDPGLPGVHNVQTSSTMQDKELATDNSCFAWIRLHRKLAGFCMMIMVTHFFWWTLAIRYHLLAHYVEHYSVALVMIVGSFFKGMSCEAGSSVVFPLMTLVLQIPEDTARDFTLMIQSCGLSAATFTVCWMGIPVEPNAIIFGSLGGLTGMITHFHFLDSLIPKDVKVMIFVSFCFAFACALFVHNMRTWVPKMRISNFSLCKALFVTAIGFIGGNLTAMSGSGIDISSFIVLTLFYQVSEKVAAPTSVVLLALHSVIGFYWRHMILNEVSSTAWTYLSVCVPVVTLCAPLGSLLASKLNRNQIGSLIYGLSTLALGGGFYVVRPSIYLTLGSLAFILVSAVTLVVLSKLGTIFNSSDFIVEKTESNQSLCSAGGTSNPTFESHIINCDKLSTQPAGDNSVDRYDTLNYI